MTCSINAVSTGVGGVVTTADNSGILKLQTTGVDALTIDAAQKVTFANTITPIVDSLNGGQLAGLRNRIINGDFRVYQRSSVTSSSAYTLDRWIVNSAGAAVNTVQGAAAFTGTIYTSAMVINGATGVTAIGFNQRIEANNSRDLAGKTITVSYWVYQNSGVSQNNTIGIYRANVTDVFTAITLDVATQTAAIPTGAWTFVSKSFSLTSAAYTGLQIDVSGIGAVVASQTVQVANFQLEIGSVATPFEQRPIGLELSLCQRYYQKFTGVISSGNTTSGTGVFTDLLFPVELRAVPTMAYSSFSNSNAGNATTNQVTTKSWIIGITITSTGYGYSLFTAETTGTEL